MPEEPAALFSELCELIRLLRSPEGSEWDRSQTLLSVGAYIDEESQELIHALNGGAYPAVRSELGDMLILTVFASTIAAEEGGFDLASVIAGATDKLRRRLAPVLNGNSRLTAEEIRIHWEYVKSTEAQEHPIERTMAGRRTSALQDALAVQVEAASVGFDMRSAGEALDKICGEVAELREEVVSRNANRQALELGDVLFSAVNASRHLSVDPEFALRRAIDRFRSRFDAVKRAFRGTDMRSVGIEEMDRVWNEAKDLEAKNEG